MAGYNIHLPLFETERIKEGMQVVFLRADSRLYGQTGTVILIHDGYSQPLATVAFVFPEGHIQQYLCRLEHLQESLQYIKESDFEVVE